MIIHHRPPTAMRAFAADRNCQFCYSAARRGPWVRANQHPGGKGASRSGRSLVGPVTAPEDCQLPGQVAGVVSHGAFGADQARHAGYWSKLSRWPQRIASGRPGPAQGKTTAPRPMSSHAPHGHGAPSSGQITSPQLRPPGRGCSHKTIGSVLARWCQRRPPAITGKTDSTSGCREQLKRRSCPSCAGNRAFDQ
jgi:hypothetical protein